MSARELNDVERRLLARLAKGETTRQIAKGEGYGEGTVRVYLHNAYRKIGVANRLQAALWQVARDARAAKRKVAA